MTCDTCKSTTETAPFGVGDRWLCHACWKAEGHHLPKRIWYEPCCDQAPSCKSAITLIADSKCCRCKEPRGSDWAFCDACAATLIDEVAA